MRHIAAAVLLFSLVNCSSGGGTHTNTPQCTPAAPCPSGTTCHTTRDCPADAGFVCTDNVCQGPCGTNDACAPGEVCATLGGKKRCLRECMDGNCPAGDAGCQTYWPDHKQVCANKVFGNACSSVENITPCTAADCGLKYYTESCVTNGSYCPHNGPCDPSLGFFSCTCEGGYIPTYCDGTPCDFESCVNHEWTCVPAGGVSTDCSDEPHQASGNCHCADGRVLPFVCGETSSCEDRCATGCNLLQQDCPDPAAPKCTYEPWLAIASYTVDPQFRARPICVPLTGTKKNGESCTRVIGSDGGVQVGLDDCDKGLYCADYGNPPGSRTCRPVCSDSSDCGDGGVCELIITALPAMGVCRQGCTLGGTDCGPGMSCVVFYATGGSPVPYCKYNGSLDAGVACEHDSECGPALVCDYTTCQYSCSPSVACVSGSCWFDPQDTANTAGYGVCF